MISKPWGYKYQIHNVLIKANRESNYNKEGIIFSALSKKWVVRIKNNKPSKYAYPFISIAQFLTKEEAEKCYNELVAI